MSIIRILLIVFFLLFVLFFAVSLSLFYILPSGGAAEWIGLLFAGANVALLSFYHFKSRRLNEFGLMISFVMACIVTFIFFSVRTLSLLGNPLVFWTEVTLFGTSLLILPAVFLIDFIRKSVREEIKN